jgi:hypothetical protein
VGIVGIVEPNPRQLQQALTEQGQQEAGRPKPVEGEGNSRAVARPTAPADDKSGVTGGAVRVTDSTDISPDPVSKGPRTGRTLPTKRRASSHWPPAPRICRGCVPWIAVIRRASVVPNLRARARLRTLVGRQVGSSSQTIYFH